jgi:murein DD-endopeptidase MepM/ murein hydrolase activator NlpD
MLSTFSRHRALVSGALAVLSLLFCVAPGAGATEGDLSPAPAGGAVWPLSPAPEIGQRFDPPDTRWGAGHRGVDLRASPGQPVRAAMGGRISFAGSLAGRGVVVVDHGATRTTYEPVEATVSVGDEVATGDRIGHLQLGGSHCFPAACLHWGWREGDTYLDPLTLVGAGPVRLLPLGGDPPGQAAPQESSTRLPTWAARSTAASSPRAPDGSGTGALFRERKV